ncbi:MAG TPA: metalloregulator ArsR/SmtB family transcription factor [Steroidobacteraceae bacterium]|nr:metalloregulator ArsR/SmtB family transcription factor [Steroidobacteraceae bacterium]
MFDHQSDRIFRALGSTNRRLIIERLSDGDATVFELAEGFAISFRAVLKHVRTLERCGLVRTFKQERARVCRLDPDTLLAAEHWMRRTLWASRRDRLGSLPQDWRWNQLTERAEGAEGAEGAD